ncbi:HD domain-containing protein [Heliobacterium gestii]|uniref:HD domain-containing protein n=1 Tax=Heliomicrobium gestii TaxID=2699 RepID=A0A845LGF8_HELGE|nr:HD-GYP domain-containing protein [Heliomicrobium gestii]MBM7867667.1 HD-GYP domain-containing protein (c-di-GMP phosphodiesterase class II) [Heliomicrobium gestii]MZP44060.1 HD domain-containing protein [Heliomicrobium gestii]
MLSKQYRVGDVLRQDVYSLQGHLLIPRGTQVSERLFAQIRKWEEIGLLVDKASAPRPRSSPEAKGDGEETAQLLQEKNQEAAHLYHAAIETVRDVFLDIREGHVFNQKAVQEQAADIVSSVIHDEKVGFRLNRLWEADDYTLHHSVDVCLLSILIGLNLGMERQELEELAVGAILHDVGKIYIPRSVLNKKSALNGKEFEMIKKHPVFGVKYFQETGMDLTDAQLYCVLQHHEHCDGTGYPQGLRYPRIHLYARVVAVADVFSALTAERPHRASMDQLHAVDILCRQSRSHLDLHIVSVLIERLRELLLHMRVRLSTGDEGYVVDFLESSPLQPTVLVTQDAFGRKVVSPYLVHLRHEKELSLQEILPGS